MKKTRMITGIDQDFVGRTLKTTGIVLLVCTLFGIYYFGLWPSIAFLSGGIWGMVNLIFIAGLIRATIRPDDVDLTRAVGLAVIKFPLLYAAGYFLIKVEYFEPLHLLAGFSLLFAIILLKVVSRAILGLDENKQENSNLGRVQ